MTSVDRLPTLEDDGLITPEVGEWAYMKYLRVWMYDQMFATGMKSKAVRVYIDLFAGAGRAKLRDSKKILPSSALLALHIPDPFDRYIFCEADPERMDALRQRIEAIAPSAPVHLLPGDVNECSDAILRLVPERAMSFCFVDPYGINIRQETLRHLSAGRRMDYLILLAVQMDANRNRALYTSEESAKMDEFLGGREWRDEWKESEKRGADFREFILNRYALAMQRIGYEPSGPELMYEMKTLRKQLSIYYLAFFSKHRLGYKFWKEVLKYNDPQRNLFDGLGI